MNCNFKSFLENAKYFILGVLICIILFYLFPLLLIEGKVYFKTKELMKNPTINTIKRTKHNLFELKSIPKKAQKDLKIKLNLNKDIDLKKLDERINQVIESKKINYFYANKGENIEDTKQQIILTTYEGIKTGNLSQMKDKLNKIAENNGFNLNFQVDDKNIYLLLKSKQKYIIKKFELNSMEV